MEDNKKEESKTEEVKVEVVDNDKKYNEKNLTNSIIFAAIILGLIVIHSILGIGVHGNLAWFILNAIFTAGAAADAIFAGLFFFNVTKDNLKKDIPSFCVSLAALVVAASFTLWWSIDMFVNLAGVIGGNL